jgi:hypothetical protein
VTTVECNREQDVLDALVAERWPDRADEELRLHVAQCAICSDVLEVAAPLLHDRNSASLESARIPSSGAMWWRAQMRARQEAERQATRPIAVAQIVGSVIAIAVMVAVGAVVSPWLRDLIAGFSGRVAASLSGIELPMALAWQGWLIPAFLIGISVLVFAPIAVYFALADD